MRTGDLLKRARRAQRTLVLADGDDERAIQAARDYEAAGLGRAILLRSAPADAPADLEVVVPTSDPRRKELAAQLAAIRGKGLSEEGAEELLADPLYFGGMIVRTGAADGMVAGATRATADVIRAAIRTVGPAAGATRVSSFFLMVPPAGPALTFADCGVIVRPTAAELADIAIRAAVNHATLTGERSRVAFLSFSTLGSAEHPEIETVRSAVEIARDSAARAGLDSSDFDGELQADAALDAAVAVIKAPGSAVAGQANVLVFPDLASGNIAYKLVQRLAGAAAFGPILQGLARPINDLSRGATAGDILAVAAITSLQATLRS